MSPRQEAPGTSKSPTPDIERLNNDDNDDGGGGASLGVLLVGLMKAAFVGLKKGAISTVVRKQAFLQIGSRVVVTAKSADPIASNWNQYSLKVLKNVVLGMTVFGTYDFVAFDFLASTLPDRHRNPIPLSTTDLFESERSIAAHSIPVVAHAGAGFCSGIAHSGALVLWEILTGKKHPHWSVRRLRVLQHSFGYAALFGTYEGGRRLLEYTVYDHLLEQATAVAEVTEFSSFHPILNWMNLGDGVVQNLAPIRWTLSFLAGGVAGEAHKFVTLAMSHSFSSQNSPWDWRKIASKMRPTAAPFAMMGMCFVAFEFGGELTELALTSDTLQKEQLRK